MALSKRIVETIGKCAGDDRQLNDDLIKILRPVRVDFTHESVNYY